VTAGGNLNAGIPDADFLVSIAGNWLSVTQASAIPVFSVPASTWTKVTLPVTTVQTVTAVYLATSDLIDVATMYGRVFTIAYSGPAGRPARPRHLGGRLLTRRAAAAATPPSLNVCLVPLQARGGIGRRRWPWSSLARWAARSAASRSAGPSNHRSF